jgi:long-chain fatty acid transport protein
MKLSGEIEFEGVEKDYGTFSGQPIWTHVDGSTTIVLPPQVQFGIRCQPSEDLSIEFDYLWTEWSVTSGYTVKLEPKLLDNRASEYYVRDWENRSQIKIGIEWVADKFVTVRGGYYFDPSPVPDHTFDFSTSDVDKKVISLGVGLNFGRLTIDTVFQYISSVQDRKNSPSGIENESLTKDFEFLFDNELGMGISDMFASYSASMQVWALGTTLNYAF